jgi:DNA modification methylase
MEDIKLYNGDCLEIMQQLIDNGVKVDMVLTDPPYGTTACKWDSIINLNEMWNKINNISNLDTPILLFGSEPFGSFLRCSNIKNYKYDWYWDKVRGVGHLNAKRQPMKNVETISVFYKKQCLYNPQMRDRDKARVSMNNNTQIVFGKSQDNFKGEKLDKKYPITLLTYSKSSKEDMMFHSSQKPVELLEYLIKTYTKEGDIVLDFTMGSGSTGVACVNTNRKFIGIELDENYFKIAKERIDI